MKPVNYRRRWFFEEDKGGGQVVIGADRRGTTILYSGFDFSPVLSEV